MKKQIKHIIKEMLLREEFDVGDAFKFIKQKEGRALPREYVLSVLKKGDISKLSIPEDLGDDKELWQIYKFVHAPETLTEEDLHVEESLDLRGCTSLESLPGGFSVGGWLDLGGCTSLESLPEGLSVGQSLYFKKTDPIPQRFGGDKDAIRRYIEVELGGKVKMGIWIEGLKSNIKNTIKETLLKEQENSYDFLTPEEEKGIRSFYEKKVWEDLEEAKRKIAQIEREIKGLENERDDTLKKITNDPTGEVKKAVEDSYGNLIRTRKGRIERERKYIDDFDAQKEVEAWIKWDKGGVSGLSHKFRYGRWKERELQRELTKQDIIDLFVTALEGGSNYWYKMDVPQKARGASGEFLSEKIGNFILGGGKVYFYDAEDPKELLGFVDTDKVLDAISAIKKQYPNIWENILLGNADASDSDVFLQLCVMGEVVFG